ncbi:ABC transporter ATP-binding protein [Mycoplasmatota bacterium]|nr:ABC transporter ATP-binding protein [Mycoplasmatota bacterium]
MRNLLEIKDLVVNYGPITALKGISLNVPKGSIVAILGANGGGKTTLLKKITGLKEAESGKVLFKGKNITKLSTEKITREGITLSPEGRQIFVDLTVEENLRIGAFKVKKDKIKVSQIFPGAINSRIKREIEKLRSSLSKEDLDNTEIKLTRNELMENNKERVYKYFPVLKERGNQIANTLSGGEQQMLAISRAMMANPELLILDEPSLGLAPLIIKSIFEIIKEFQKEGTTVLIVEQNALQTLKIADYAYVIQVGELILEGSAKDLMKDPKLVEAYLGD